MSFHGEDRSKVVRGTIFTILGGVALALYNVSGFLLRGLFGGEAYGLFAIAYFVVEFSAHFLITGFNDAVTYFVAPHVHQSGRPLDGREDVNEDDDGLYRVLSTCFWVPIALSVVIAIGLHWFVDGLYSLWWEGHDPKIIELIRIALWGLPLFVCVQLPVEALKSKLEVRWAVIVIQVMFPYMSLAFILILYFGFDLGIESMCYAMVGSLLCCLPVSVFAFARHFSLRKTLWSIFRLQYEPAILRFAFPQSINMTLSLSMVRIDGMVLSAFVSANSVGIYKLVVDATQYVRLVKMAFSGLYGPLVAKYQATKNRKGLQQALHLFSRLSSSLCIPLLLVVMASYESLIFQGSNQVWNESRLFPWLLCIGPVMSCFFGFASNTLLMSGYSKILLINGVFASIVNFLLNLWWIPMYGLLGAALATAIASVAISLTQVVELSRFVGLRFHWRLYARTVGGSILPVSLVLFSYGERFQMWIAQPWNLSRANVAVIVSMTSVTLYLAILLGWPGKNPVRSWIYDRWSAVMRKTKS